MSNAATATPWKCRACGVRLGIILDGVLRLEGRVVTVDRWGLLAVRCACGQARFWRPERSC